VAARCALPRPAVLETPASPGRRASRLRAKGRLAYPTANAPGMRLPVWAGGGRMVGRCHHCHGFAERVEVGSAAENDCERRAVAAAVAVAVAAAAVGAAVAATVAAVAHRSMDL